MKYNKLEQSQRSSEHQILLNEMHQHDTNQSPKRLINTRRKVLCLPIPELMIHTAAITFTIGILALGISNVWFSDLTWPPLNSLLNIFQFVARLHEFLVTTSIGIIVLHHIRYELIIAKGVQYGFVVSAFQLSSPSFLFSSSFWKTAARGKRNPRNVIMAILLLVSSLLIALTGPSLAILVLPQVSWWPIKDPFSGTTGNTFLTGAHTDIWPSIIDSSHIPEECDPTLARLPNYCPFASFQQISLWPSEWVDSKSMPNLTIPQLSGCSRYLSASSNQTKKYSVASTAMTTLAEDLSFLWLYAQQKQLTLAHVGRPMISMSMEQKIMKPLTQIQCSDPYDITNVETINVTFPTNQIVLNPGEDPVEDFDVKINTTIWKQRTDVQLNFTNIESSHPLLGVLIGMTFMNPQDTPFFSNASDSARGLMVCTIEARWAPTSLSLDPQNDNIVILSDPDPYDIVSSLEKMNETQVVKIDLSFANRLNAPITEDFTVFEFILKWFYVANGYFDGWWNHKWPWMIATAINLELSDALSRITYHNGDTIIWFDNTTYSAAINLVNLDLHQGIVSYPNQTKISFPEFANANPELYTPVVWTIQQFGYAWGFRTVTVYLAITVVSIYLLLVMTHIVVSVLRSWHCSSWTTLQEFFDLALISTPPKDISCTKSVKIAESIDKKSANMVMME